MLHLPFGREIWIVGAVVCILWITAQVLRNARRLNAGVRAFKEEQEKQSGVVDPYAAMASLYSPVEQPPQKQDE